MDQSTIVSNLTCLELMACLHENLVWVNEAWSISPRDRSFLILEHLPTLVASSPVGHLSTSQKHHCAYSHALRQQTHAIILSVSPLEQWHLDTTQVGMLSPCSA